jgi:hypothetical protein
VTIPAAKSGARPAYLSPNTESLSIALVSVDGKGVTGVNPTIVNTVAKARGCTVKGQNIVCSATAAGSPGNDVFAATAYAGTDATGDVLSVGSVQATIASGGGSVGISNALSLTLDGVIASLQLRLDPKEAKRGVRTTSVISLTAYDASGAQIVGPADYSQPITLAIEGDTNGAFRLHDASGSGTSLSIPKPSSGITLFYDGNKEASAVTIQASVSGPSSISANAGFALRGKEPPPPVGTIYVLNLGSKDGASAVVTEYDGKAKGNAAPERTLSLSSKLYARSIAVDSGGNLYVGYLDNDIGFNPETGEPDPHNEIAIYAPGASGNAQPTAVLTADKETKTTLFPISVVFDPSGRLVTYGSTDVDGNDGDAVLTYSAGSSGAAPPADAWSFSTPQIRYAGPTGLALDSGGNFYVNGALHTSLGPDYGLFVAPVSDIGDPQTEPSRTIPWDSTTELEPGLTEGVALSASGEIFIANAITQGSGSSTSCQGRANVFAAGADGGTTDDPPLRVLTLGGVFTQNPECDSARNALAPFFPTIALYGTTLFVADDFNDAVSAFSSGAGGTVKASLRIAGSATQLDAPMALAITSASGQAKARPAYPVLAPTLSIRNVHT